MNYIFGVLYTLALIVCPAALVYAGVKLVQTNTSAGVRMLGVLLAIGSGIGGLIVYRLLIGSVFNV